MPLRFQPSVGSSGHTIQDEGSALAARAKLDFIGSAVTVTDDSANDKTKVTIDGAALATSAPPAANGSGSAGTASTAARGDHQHPSGTLLPSGVFVPVVIPDNSSFTPTKNREFVIGCDLAPQTIDRLTIMLFSVGDAGAVVRVGLRSDLNLQPGPPVHEQTIAADATNGPKQTTAIGYNHPGGILWISYTAQGWTTTAPVIRGNSKLLASFVRPWAGASWLTLANIGTTPQLVGAMDGVTGSLPTVFTPTGGSVGTTLDTYIKRA